MITLRGFLQTRFGHREGTIGKPELLQYQCFVGEYRDAWIAAVKIRQLCIRRRIADAKTLLERFERCLKSAAACQRHAEQPGRKHSQAAFADRLGGGKQLFADGDRANHVAPTISKRQLPTQRGEERFFLGRAVKCHGAIDVLAHLFARIAADPDERRR